jgi:hypothetical protein
MKIAFGVEGRKKTFFFVNIKDIDRIRPGGVKFRVRKDFRKYLHSNFHLLIKCLEFSHVSGEIFGKFG